MLGNKSNSKRILLTKNQLAANEQTSTNNFYKRYKSQEIYLTKSKKYLKKTSNEKVTPFITNSSTNLISMNKELLQSDNNKLNQTPILLNKKKSSLSPENLINSKKLSYRYKNSNTSPKMPLVNKIMNDESIQELDTEENISLNESDEMKMDEMKSSDINLDFYTDKTAEASKSIIEKGKKLINNLPQPFVKPLKTQFININLNSESEEKVMQNECIASSREMVKSSSNQNIQLSTNIIQLKSQINSNTSKIINLNDASNTNQKSTLEKKDSKTQISITSNKIKSDHVILENYHRKMLLASKKGDRDTFLECLEIILNSPNGDINYKDESGWTALHHSSDEGNLKIVDILINTNADVNCKTNNKKTPLHLSTAHGYFDISKLLVENNSIINSPDDEKNTPVHICAITGHIELLKYLLDKCAQADARNIYGKKPLDLAKKEDVKNLLKDYLKKSDLQYTKIHIHSTNQKSVNNFLKNFPVKSSQNDSSLSLNTSNNIKSYNQKNNLNTSIKNFNPVNPMSIGQIMKNTLGGLTSNHVNSNTKGHNKYQSNDFNNKISSAFHSNNNININISTNINHPSGNINVVNLNNKDIKINDKLQVTVETQMNHNTSSNYINSNQPSSNHKPLSQTRTMKFNNFHTKGLKSASNKTNLNSTINSSRDNKLQGNKLTSEFNSKRITKKEEEIKSPKNKQSTRVLRINLDSSHKIDKSPKLIDINENQNKFVEKENKIQNFNAIEILDVTNSNDEASSNDKLQANLDLTGSKNQSQSQNFDQSQTQNLSQSQSQSQNLSQNPSQSQNLTLSNTYINSKSNSESIDGENDSKTLDEEKIGPGSFICHALVGKGSFGEVFLVEKKNTKTLYAMKVLLKDKIMAQNLIKYAMTERNVLSITNHPFIVKLNFSFQSSDKLFLILDYCPGGDLAEHLARENRFSEERAKIYVCEIILALEYLHKRDIIFRDLKPDNVVLDIEGHAQLTDFGLSREGVLDSKSAKSFCGSIAYLAPEMLRRTGHGKAVDWYLLGVLFYEMLVGIPPYFTNNKEQLFKNIEKAELQIPNFVSVETQDILRALLQKNPQMRLGSGKNDAYDIKKHPYFKDVNWDDVYDRKLKPPIPKLRNQVMRKFSSPIEFKENSNNPGVYILNTNSGNHFDGWSFINNEENQSSINDTKLKN